MMNWFDTVAARNFFQGRVPAIQRELKRIADGLERANELKERELNLVKDRETNPLG